MHELFGPNYNLYHSMMSTAFPWATYLGTDIIGKAGTTFNEPERVQVSLSTFPATASWKQLSHFAQLINSGLFEAYD